MALRLTQSQRIKIEKLIEKIMEVTETPTAISLLLVMEGEEGVHAELMGNIKTMSVINFISDIALSNPDEEVAEYLESH